MSEQNSDDDELEGIVEVGAEDQEEMEDVAEDRIELSAQYDYALREVDERERYENEAKLKEYGTNWFPICAVGAVIFPDQLLPMQFDESEREIFDRLIGSAQANGFVVLHPLDIEECQNLPYISTLAQVVQTNSRMMSMELRGVHRCKVLEYSTRNDGEALIQLLPEVELPHILNTSLPKFAMNYSHAEKRSLAFRITGYPFNALRDISQIHMDEIEEEMTKIMPAEPIKEAKDRGMIYFSYFVAKHMFSNRKIEYEILKENSANTRLAIAAKYCRVTIGKCSRCAIHIFNSAHILRLPEQTMTHVNAHGYVHRINLLSQVQNYVRASPPSFEFTWFPGYAWMIIQCRRCEQHLGWEYISSRARPHRFFGIQREGVVFGRDGEIFEEQHIEEEEEGEDDEDSDGSSEYELAPEIMQILNDLDE